MNHYTIGILSHNISMRFSSGPQPDSSLDHNFHSFNEVLCTDVAPAGFLPTSQVGGWFAAPRGKLQGRGMVNWNPTTWGFTGNHETMKHGFWLVTSERLFSNTTRTVYLSCNGLLLVFFGVAFKVLN